MKYSAEEIREHIRKAEGFAGDGMGGETFSKNFSLLAIAKMIYNNTTDGDEEND